MPVVGTFVNWWSPKNKESGVRGRSLNLTQGVVESTENIYKYHMQLSGGITHGGTKSPPTPLIQTPVGASHSRSSSHASSQSGTVQPPQLQVNAIAQVQGTKSEPPTVEENSEELPNSNNQIQLNLSTTSDLQKSKSNEQVR